MIEIPGFDSPARDKHKYLRRIQDIRGLEKCGKTHYALSAPAPLAIIDLDNGLDDLLEKEEFASKEILPPARFDWREFETQKQWRRLWDDINKCFKAALKAKGLRTIVIDTGTELWEIARLAYLGQLSNVKAHWYGPVNAAMDAFYTLPFDYDKNVIITHKVKDEYIKDVRTGNMERDGWKRTGNKVQEILEALRDKDGDFIIKVHDSRKCPELKGMELSDPLNSFPGLATLIYPETDTDYWE